MYLEDDGAVSILQYINDISVSQAIQRLRIDAHNPVAYLGELH